METEVKLTKLSNCAGCGAKVGAGTLAQLLDGIQTNYDENLIVGFDKSDDACVYLVDKNTAMIQTVDFFPPIVDDPFLFGQIAAANALSDIYAMGGEPRTALNIMCTTDAMDDHTIKEVLRGGYSKVYEAGAVIAGGHTIKGMEPLYGLSVTGLAQKKDILKNSEARPGDVLILTKPLGVGIITTAYKADLALVPEELMQKIYAQMTTLNKYARDIMVKYEVHACTDVTGFGLIGHTYEMAEGSGVSIHLDTHRIPYHKEALEYAQWGLVPAGAYRNRTYAERGVQNRSDSTLAFQDLLFDPQTSGGLLIAAAEESAGELLQELKQSIPEASVIGYAADKEEHAIILE